MKYFMLSLLGLAVTSPVFAAEENTAENVLHIYSSRHYNTDEALYTNFEEQTGITIKRVDGKGDALIARLKEEGMESKADLFITVDAGRLYRAEQAGLFAPIQSDTLRNKIPANLRDPNGAWYGFSSRARVIVYNKDSIDPATIQNYEDLAKPEMKGNICIRSSSNIYNLSLTASMISLKGVDATKAWAQGLLDNLARKPQGGDTDQMKAIFAGACDIAVVNSYYYARLKRSDKQADRDVVANMGVIFPDQNNGGTHINISGAGVLKSADNVDAAVRFLEYLASDQAQYYFSAGNNEYPVVSGVKVNDALKTLGEFKSQDINVKAFGEHQAAAQKIFNQIAFP